MKNLLSVYYRYLICYYRIRGAAKIYKTGCHIAIVDSSEQDSQENSQGNSKNKEELEKEKPKEVKTEDIQSKNITEIIKKLEAVKLFLRNVYDPISV